MADTDSPLANIDIHGRDGRLPNAAINIRQSKFHTLKVKKPKALRPLMELATGDRKQRQKSRQALIKMISADADAVEFILDHVIPRTFGPLPPGLRDEIKAILIDPRNWDQDTISYSLTTARPAKRGLFHIDSSDACVLRVLYAEHLSTELREGWFESVDTIYAVENPALAEGQNAPSSQYRPEGGHLILFDCQSGVHAPPEISQAFLDQHARRSAFSASFNMADMVERAIAKAGQRRSFNR